MSYKLVLRGFNGILGIITLYSFIHTFIVPPPVPWFVRIAGPGGLFLGGTIGVASALVPDKLYALLSNPKYGNIVRAVLLAFGIYMIGMVEVFFAPRTFVGVLSGFIAAISFAILIPLVVFFYDRLSRGALYAIIVLIIALLALSLPNLESLAQLLGPAAPPGLYFTAGLLFHEFFEHTYTLVFANAVALKPRVLQYLYKVKEKVMVR